MDRPVTDAERVHFTSYARHVRILHLYAEQRIDPTVFLRLSCVGLPLTPRLRVLRVGSTRPPYIDMAVPLLCGPALRKLTLTFGRKDATDVHYQDSKLRPLNRHMYTPRVLLADVAAAATGLASLQVRGGAHISLFTPIASIHTLRRLELTRSRLQYGTEFLRELAKLEKLEELVLPNTFDVRNAARCRGFERLRYLGLFGGARTVPELLSAMPDLRLRELRLADMDFEDIRSIRAIATSLSTGPGVHLETLTLGGRPSNILSFIDSVSLSTCLAPFFVLRGIRNLRLESAEALKTTDGDLRLSGSAWPQLRSLWLRYVGSLPDEGAPTINGIVELARNCSGLQEVALGTDRPRFSARLVVPSDAGDGSSDRWIPDETIHDVQHVARVLHSIFGELKPIPQDKKRKWDLVLHEMSRLQEETGDGSSANIVFIPHAPL